MKSICDLDWKKLRHPGAFAGELVGDSLTDPGRNGRRFSFESHWCTSLRWVGGEAYRGAASGA